ncbi:hypothetical protein BDW74DRAFT_71369 [Aspergillus multicolor]|uniref:uncharacterized protein n=1 Tax=Aspergillus multicolor TaxID=41759 RepID=UPI003CCE059A
MGLAFDSDSSLSLGGPGLGQGVNNTSNDHHLSILASGPDTAEEQIESGRRAQMPTLLPIPLNPWIQAAVYIPLLKITETERANMLQAFAPFRYLLPDFSLPSRESLTRFLNAYFDGVYLHMPFIHCASFNPEKHPLELVLAMAAAGAQHRYQHRTGRMLYYASKTIFQERQRVKVKARGVSNTQHLTAAGSVTSGPFSTTSSNTDDLRCLLNLMIYGTWQQDPELVQEACDLQSQFVGILRDSGLVEENASTSAVSNLDWHTWLELEAARRVKLFGFALLNLQSIAYNLPPILLSTEINLRLPCTCDEWRTVNEIHWKQVRQNIPHEQNLFQDALTSLLDGSKPTPPTFQPTPNSTPSPTANILTMHALLQRILLARQAALSTTVPQSDILMTALRHWTSTWQLAPESSLDPLNPNGPIPFTSTALLGLAYTRLQLDLGPHRLLRTRHPLSIARALHNSPPVSRDHALLPALLHATHALSIPVKLGVEYVSRSQAFVWSIQHALCGLEFAVLLEKWLRVVGRTRGVLPLEEHEQRLLDWIRRVVDEGRLSIEDGEGREHGHGHEDGPFDSSNCDHLASVVVKLWARIMRGNAQWPLVDVIGQSLEMYAGGAGAVGTNMV